MAVQKNDLLSPRAISELWGHDADGVAGKIDISRAGAQWVPIWFRSSGAMGSAGSFATTDTKQNCWIQSKSLANQDVLGVMPIWTEYVHPGTGEADAPFDYTNWQASIQIGQLVQQFKFAKSKAVNLYAGKGVLVSDPLPILIPAGSTYVIRSYGEWSGTPVHLNSVASRVGVDGAARGTALTSQVMDAYNATAPGYSGGGVLAPVTVLGLVKDAPRHVFGVRGDSIAFGFNDVADADGNRGYVYRALGYTYPWVTVARGSTTAQMSATRSTGQDAVLAMCKPTKILNALGRNDIWTGRTAAQTKADMATINAVDIAAGREIWAVTIPPSTDAGNTAITNSGREAQRLIYNADIRATFAAQGYAGIIDVAASCEDANNPGFWRTDLGTPTSDGTHPADVLHAAIAAAFPAEFFE